MAILRRCLWIFLTLMLAGNRLVAASGAENRAYAAAVKAFQDGMWERAATELAQFAEKYPESELLPEAWLLQAQAEFKQQKFAATIALLTARTNVAGALADRYLYWIGEAQFENTNYAAAAVAFGRVAARDFPVSARRLEASVGEAAARAKLGEWPRVVALLQNTNSAFQQAAQTSTNNEVVARGWLLLAEAGLGQNHFAEAEAALQSLTNRSLPLSLNWQKQYLLCRIQLAAGRPADALRDSAGLLTLAEGADRRDLLAESVAFRAGIMEQTGQRDEAITLLKRNLAADVPVARQRQALARITELALAQNQLAEATQTLEKFLEQFTNAPAADMALLTLGELQLKQQVAPATTNAPPTNLVASALTQFDRVINVFSNSALVGKAQLGRGWCYWIDGKMPESADAFRAAAARLPVSEDLAVARFKLGDALFAQNDFAGALTNYHAALEVATNWPRAQAELAAPALYQMLRANLAMKNAAGATAAMQQLLQSQPQNDLAARALLLVGQGLATASETAAARDSYAQFVELFPDSGLRPQVELAIARMQEQQGDWPAAVRQYDAWLDRFATNSLRPAAEFYRALANYRAGNETNALTQFTNFVASFATNELAPSAQWWVADYYFRTGDFLDAEKNYKLIFQNWKTSELAYEARMMAGRAALARLVYPDAIDHFTNLTSNPNCPPALKVQALFAYGGALMHLAGGATNQLANYEEAIRVFNIIPQSYPTNEAAALAWGEIGNCYLQLATADERQYSAATNAYQQALDLPQAGIGTRSQAQWGQALVLEKMAERKTGDPQLALRKLALNRYLDVFYYEKNLRPGETPAWFWVIKAGMDAERLAELLEDWEAAASLCERLQNLPQPLPQALSASLEKKKARAREHVADAGK